MTYTLRSIEELIEDCHSYMCPHPIVERKEGEDWAFTKIVHLEDKITEVEEQVYGEECHRVCYFVDTKDVRCSFKFDTWSFERLWECVAFFWDQYEEEDGELCLEITKTEEDCQSVTWKIFRDKPRIEVKGPSDFSFAVPREVADACFEDNEKEKKKYTSEMEEKA